MFGTAGTKSSGCDKLEMTKQIIFNLPEKLLCCQSVLPTIENYTL